MVKVLKTNSGFYVAFKDDVELTAEETYRYKTADYSDPKVEAPFVFKGKFPKADAPLTRALMKEIKSHIPSIGKTINELEDDTDFRKHVLEIGQRTGRNHCYAHYTIKSADLPSDYNDCPVSLHREEEYYFSKYDAKKQRYICCDERGHEIKINSLRASFNFKKMEVTVYDKAFFFTPQETEAIKKINRLVRKQPVKNVLNAQPPQIRALYDFYCDISKHYLNKNQKLYSFSHELQHAQTQQRINRRRKQPNHKELSPTNCYRFDEDSEKAAHLKETYLAITKFFQKGGDLSVFPDKCQWLVNRLKDQNFDKQKQLLQDNNFIVNSNIQNWNNNYADHYIDQRCQLTIDYVWDAAVLRMEDGDEEYLARRSCAYTMDIYNPQTGEMEKQDLSKFIQIPTIIREDERKNVELAETIRRQRLNTLKQNGIDLKLILSLFNETYQEPFKTHSPQKLREQILEKGISFKSKNNNSEPITIKAQKQSSPGRPDCIKLTTYRNGQPSVGYTLDKDRNEYICLNYNNNKRYSNLKGSKHPSLPDEIERRMLNYIKEAEKEVQKRVIQIINGSGGNSL